MLLDLRERESNEQGWSDSSSSRTKTSSSSSTPSSTDEETEWARQHAAVGLKFNEWFQPSTPQATAAPHPFGLE
jgi:hypothetical protein